MIKQIRSRLSPWRVYQRVRTTSKVSFFLDSPEFRKPNQLYSYMGWDPFLEVKVQNGKVLLSGEEKGSYPAAEWFSVLRRIFKKHKTSSVTHPFFTGGAVGYWGYELASLFEKKIRFRRKPGPEIPQLYLGFYRELLVYDHQKKVYYQVGSKKLPEFQNFEKPFQFKKFRPEISKAQFESMVRKAKRYIAAGDIYQANLSQRFAFDYEGSSVPLYNALRKINPSPFSSFLKFGDLEILSSSPERLVSKRGRTCETRPIAGTRKKIKGAHRELLSNEKERAEHIMLVDLERNDLGRVCDPPTVKVDEMMKIEKYSHVVHIVSKITGRLSKQKDALDLIRAMFPGGTITGCPKIRCMEIIDELEPKRRGVYTGSLGHMGFDGNLDLNIIIRTLVLQKGKGYFQVGAGIVHDSNPEREYEETLHKGEAMMSALVKANQ